MEKSTFVINFLRYFNRQTQERQMEIQTEIDKVFNKESRWCS